MIKHLHHYDEKLYTEIVDSIDTYTNYRLIYDPFIARRIINIRDLTFDSINWNIYYDK